MLKKIPSLLLICFFFGCGYEPLYIKGNDLNKPIKNFKLEGDQKANEMILSFLGLKEDRAEKTGYSLTLNSNKKIEVISKDKNGNPSVYRSSIVVDFLLSHNKQIIKKKKFDSSFTYNNYQNKFDLSQYQKTIELNLINEISEKIFIFLKS